MENQGTYKFFAFISYNSKDVEWGKRLQKKLENYRMPATLCSERGWKRTPINPVFFAPTDIQPGGLSEELQERLRRSRHLIVICSPNSARSEWVGREIAFFHSLGRTKQIHFFIVNGIPHSGDPATECFNPVVEQLGLPEILGANIHEKIYRWPWLNRERAYVQLISKLLGIEFDTIWQRHRRQLIMKGTLWTVGSLAVLTTLFAVWRYNRPVDVTFRLQEASVHNPHLPALEEAVITLTLENETKTDTLRTLDGVVRFANIPHRCLGRQAEVSFRAYGYQPRNMSIELEQEVVLPVSRNDSLYGDVHFRVWDSGQEVFVPGVEVELAGQKAVSGPNGEVSLFVPLAQQRAVYPVKASLPLESDSLRMPSGAYDVINVVSSK